MLLYTTTNSRCTSVENDSNTKSWIHQWIHKNAYTVSILKPQPELHIDFFLTSQNLVTASSKVSEKLPWASDHSWHDVVEEKIQSSFVKKWPA